MNTNNEQNLISLVRNVVTTYKATVGEPVSLADIGKIARVEPITLISSNLTGCKDLYNILHGVLNIYAGFYLQAIHILSAQLTDVRILKILDKTNPDRDLKTLLSSGYTAYENFKETKLSKNIRTLSLEHCKYRLPMLNSDQKSSFATESIWKEEDESTLNTSISKLESFEKLGAAVGKLIQVKFNVRNEGKTSDEISIPVSVKLDNMIIPSEVMHSIVAMNKEEITLGSRFKEALAGRIGFIKDFLLCSDLIKQQKKTMIKDPTGFYNTLLKRINNSRLYSALSGNISLAGISSVFVISEEDELEIQKKIGGKLTNQKTREMVFNNTSAMMLVCIDKSWERVSIYIRDIDGFSQNSFSDFKVMTDKSSDVVSDFMKSFALGNAPSF